MRPAPDLGQAARRVLEKGVIPAIGVRLQISAISVQELLRSGALSRRGVVIHDHRMIFVTVIRPDAPRTSERKFYVQHLHAGIVRADYLGLEQYLLERYVQRIQQIGAL